MIAIIGGSSTTKQRPCGDCGGPRFHLRDLSDGRSVCERCALSYPFAFNQYAPNGDLARALTDILVGGSRYMCDRCHQYLPGPEERCNSGLHVGPDDGNAFNGRAVPADQRAWRPSGASRR